MPKFRPHDESSESRSWQPYRGVLAATLAILAIFPWIGADIWYHLTLGRSVVASGMAQPPEFVALVQPHFVNVYWLFQTISYAFFRVSGPVGLNLVFGSLVFAVGTVWARTTRVLRLGALGAFVLLWVLFIAQLRFELRPEWCSFLFLAIFLHFLETWNFEDGPSWRQALVLVLVQVLWTNMHVYFFLGPAVVATKAIAAAIGGRQREARHAALLFVLTLISTVISPHGPKGWIMVMALGQFLREMHGRVVEFQPPVGIYLRVWNIELFWLAWLAVFGLTILVGKRRAKDKLFAIVLALLGLAASATGIRNLCLLPLLAAPLLRDGFSGVTKNAPQDGGQFRFLWLALLALAGGAGIGLALARQHPPLPGEAPLAVRYSDIAFPLQFSAFLREQPVSGLMFNVAEDGGYLAYWFPKLRIFGDSRFVDSEPVQEYFDAASDPRHFAALDERWHFSSALLPVNLMFVRFPDGANLYSFIAFDASANCSVNSVGVV